MSFDELTNRALLTSNAFNIQGFPATANALFVLAQSRFFEPIEALPWIDRPPRMTESDSESA